MSGSSPRVWGPRPHLTEQPSHCRFIPTRVGTTGMSIKWASSPAVHPHACGDHVVTHGDRLPYRGSSPRVWGPQVTWAKEHRTVRFIPTRVGTTTSDKRSATAMSVHPHACGDHSGVMPVAAVISGSSPRVWGPHRNARPRARWGRFIPTRVGTTTSLPGSLTARSVHPHACGDHTASRSSDVSHCGSSPRVWGPLTPGHHARRKKRFIPTRVGPTERGRGDMAQWSVHPHACGDHATGTASRHASTGSSPRVWGPLLVLVIAGEVQRFIPCLLYTS